MAVDVDRAAIERGRGKGLDLTLGSFEDFRLPDKPDVITMFHVLEHLFDPGEVLRNLRRNSHSQTRLVVEVPIIEKGFTNDLNGFFSIQHMTHFSLNSLTVLVELAGWQVVEGTAMDRYNGYRLIAVPGNVQKSSASRDCTRDRNLALRYLGSYYRNLEEIGERIDNWPRTSRAVIWGAGAHTEFLYQATDYFRQNSARKYILVDSAVKQTADTWRGLNLYAPALGLGNIDWSDCALVISSYGWQDAIEQSAIEAGVPRSAIRKIYDHIAQY